MKRLVVTLLTISMFASPLFAAKRSTVTIQETVMVGSTQISAGDYRLTYEGTGPLVKVTLAKEGVSPIVLEAKLVANKNNRSSVTYASPSGSDVHLLQQIDLKDATLIFENTN